MTNIFDFNTMNPKTSKAEVTKYTLVLNKSDKKLELTDEELKEFSQDKKKLQEFLKSQEIVIACETTFREKQQTPTEKDTEKTSKLNTLSSEITQLESKLAESQGIEAQITRKKEEKTQIEEGIKTTEISDKEVTEDKKKVKYKKVKKSDGKEDVVVLTGKPKKIKAQLDKNWKGYTLKITGLRKIEWASAGRKTDEKKTIAINDDNYNNSEWLIKKLWKSAVKNIDLDETIEIKGAETKIGKFVDYSLWVLAALSFLSFCYWLWKEEEEEEEEEEM